MSQILDFLVLLFATVGLIAVGRSIFRSGWGNIWKAVGVMVVVSLWWAMVNSPYRGRWGADHGELIDMVATFGVVIATAWGVRRVGNDWIHQTAVVATALAFLIVMWAPRFTARGGILPSIGRSTPLNPHSQRGEERDDSFDCDALSYEGKQAAGCPD